MAVMWRISDAETDQSNFLNQKDLHLFFYLQGINGQNSYKWTANPVVVSSKPNLKCCACRCGRHHQKYVCFGGNYC